MAKKLKFQAPTGMHDILPPEQKYLQKVWEVVRTVAEFYGFEEITIPLLEEAELFSKGIGLSTDIVEKQMYTLRTRGGDFLAVRPEFTAGLVRAYIEHGMATLPQPVKLYTSGPVFRAERPQAGRYHQFHQLDLEVFGEKASAIDAQLIQICYNILQELKLKNIIVEVNSIGDSQCRPYYKKLLVHYLKARQTGLCADCRRRLKENPLRVLDCKEEKCQRVVLSAPQMIDHLCQECKGHFKEVLEFLEELELPYSLNHFLVRGLDYYTKTVFEIFEGELAPEKPVQTQNSEGRVALFGGGRFDTLVKLLGGRETPACGVAGGVERIIQALKTRDVKFPGAPTAQVFLAQIGFLAKKKSLKLFEDLRKARISVSESFGRDSLKAQLGRAQKSQATLALILGQKEALEGTIIIRDMEVGRQETVKMEKLVEEVKKKLKVKS